MMRDHVFGHGTTLRVPGSPDHSKAMVAYQPDKGAGINPRRKAKERTKKEKARKELILNPDFSAPETPIEEGYGHA